MCNLLPIIFFFQFSYLYSFSPSKLSDEEQKKIMEDFKIRHKELAEANWSKLDPSKREYRDEDYQSFLNKTMDEEGTI